MTLGCGERDVTVLYNIKFALPCGKCANACVPQNLHKQLEEAIQDGEIWVMQLKDTEYELEGSRERVQQQATEILHKASKTLYASNLKTLSKHIISYS